ncbi:MAG: NAD(P)/FAD-dependent oxidoreductase [Chloroflexota bacterium]
MKTDAVVIGSGIGGICAASLLAHYGYKPILLEKLDILGGRYTTIDYHGYLITSGAIYIDNIRGSTIQVLAELGLEPEVKVVMPKPFLKYRIDGKDYEVPEKGGIMRLLSLVSKDEAEANRVATAFKRALAWQEPSDEIDFWGWLSRYTDNQKIYRVWHGLACTMGNIELDRMKAGAFIRMVKMFRASGSGYLWAKGHNRDIINVLSNYIKAKGGQILTRTRVKHIKVKDGVAAGVIAEQSGKELDIDARLVLSNAGPKETVRLAGQENFDRGHLKEVEMSDTPCIGINMFFECDQPMLDFPGVINIVDTEMPCSVMDPSLTWPTYAPSGKNVLWLWQPVTAKPRSIEEELQKSLNHCRQNFKDFDKHCRLLIVQTFQGDWPVMRSTPGTTIDQKTTVENLYNVGDGVSPFGYVMGEGAAESARVVMEDIKKRMPPSS